MLISHSVAAFFAVLLCMGTAAHAADDSFKHFEIKAKPLADALMEFGVQSGLTVVAPTTLTAGKKAAAVRGDLAPTDALGRLLKGSGLSFARATDGTIAIQAIVSNGSVQASARESGSDKDLTHESKLEEIVVTGTQIHGAEPTARVSEYTRTDIEAQGFGNVSDFMQSLPQNIGSASASTNSGLFGGAGNQARSTGVDLRGLGPTTTLVLLDGHRLAPGSAAGNIVDVSLIPLSAIERVEVMPDGASAIYGSDAVGGVVNFILRHDLEGAETSLRYGSVTDGARDEAQVSQAVGHRWDSGSVLAVYDFDRTTALFARDRDYTDTLPDPNTLLPSQDRQSVLLTSRQDLGTTLQVFGDGLFSHRKDQEFQTFLPGYREPERQNVDAYMATVGIRGDVSDAIRFEISSNYSSSHTHEQIRNLSDYYGNVAGALSHDGLIDDHMLSVDGKLDGALAELPTGPLLFAVGGQFRRESYFYVNNAGTATNFENARKIIAGFVELHIPLVNSTDSQTHTSVLELELANRYEHFTDMGGTDNPKVGLIWRAMRGLTFRASYGTSFVAPLLSDLNPTPSQVAAIPAAYLTPGAPDAIFLFGGNPNLTAQKSKNLTLGVDFNALPNWALHANYYQITYSEKITNAGALLNVSTAFQNEAILGPSIVQLNPSPSYLQTVESLPTFQNFGVANLATIGALIDSRQQNLAAVKTRGVDFGTSYKLNYRTWTNEVGVDGTYILKFDNQFTPTAPITSFLNRAYNPVDLKLRAWASAQCGPVQASAFLNYTNSYLNPLHAQPIASWETVDLSASYKSDSQTGLLRGTTLRLSVTNLMDRAPPYVANALGIFGFDYDGVNANPLGRFVSIQLLKSW